MVMSQYDNTDSGAVFPPRDNHQMILSGKANNNGKDSQVIVTKSTLPDGRVIMDIYEKTGTLFPNEKKTSDKAPDYTGPVGTRRVAAWRKSKDNMNYMSLSFSDKMEGGAPNGQQQQPVDDSIPF
jgi:hypothetical protein